MLNHNRVKFFEDNINKFLFIILSLSIVFTGVVFLQTPQTYNQAGNTSILGPESTTNNNQIIRPLFSSTPTPTVLYVVQSPQDIYRYWNIQNITQSINDAGFTYTNLSYIPGNYSNYDIIIYDVNVAVNSSTASLLEPYVKNGGNIILFSSQIYYMGNPTWCGASGYTNEGGNAFISYNNPFNSNLSYNKLMYYNDVNTYDAAYTSVDVNSTVFSNWASGNIFGFNHSYYNGSIIWFASNPGSMNVTVSNNWREVLSKSMLWTTNSSPQTQNQTYYKVSNKENSTSELVTSNHYREVNITLPISIPSNALITNAIVSYRPWFDQAAGSGTYSVYISNTPPQLSGTVYNMSTTYPPWNNTVVDGSPINLGMFLGQYNSQYYTGWTTPNSNPDKIVSLDITNFVQANTSSIYSFTFHNDGSNGVGFWDISVSINYSLSLSTPNLAPVITAPTDFNYRIGNNNDTIQWTIIDNNPVSCIIYQNGTIVDTKQITINSTITYSLAGLQAGTYNFTLIVYDSGSLSSTETINVVITPAPITPTVTSPQDITYKVGSNGNAITWIGKDDNPNTYVIYQNNTAIKQGSWSSGDSITINVDGLKSGVYVYKLVLVDHDGLKCSDKVIVTVTNGHSSVVTNPSNNNSNVQSSRQIIQTSPFASPLYILLAVISVSLLKIYRKKTKK